MNSNNTQAVDLAVQTVQVDLTEKGLTDLSAMLVKSGRMSAASFRDWAHRTQQFAGRWSQDTKKGTKGPSTTLKKSKAEKSKSSKKSNSAPTISAKRAAQEATKFVVLKKLVPSCKLGSWTEVKNLSSEKALLLQKAITEVFILMKDKQQSDGKSIKLQMEESGLTTTEIKESKTFMPYLPRYQSSEGRKDLEGANLSEKGSGHSDGRNFFPTPPESQEIPGLAPKSSNSGIENESYSNTMQEHSYDVTPVSGNTTKLDVKDLIPCHDETDKDKLTEIFRRYDWTSIPSAYSVGLIKTLQNGGIVVGITNNQWKKLSFSEKFTKIEQHFASGK